MCVCFFTKHCCTQDHALKASTRYGASTDADRQKPFLKSHWIGGVASPRYGTSVNDWWRIKPRVSTQGTCKHCRAQPKCTLCRVVFWMEDTQAQVTSWDLMSQYKLLFCFTQNSYLPFEWGFIHLSSPVLLGEASCSLNLGSPGVWHFPPGVSVLLPVQAPAPAQHGSEATRTAGHWCTVQDHHTSSGDCPRQNGSRGFLRRGNNVSKQYSRTGCSCSQRSQGRHRMVWGLVQNSSASQISCELPQTNPSNTTHPNSIS